MTNPVPDIPDETLSPNTIDQCHESPPQQEAPPPPTPHTDPQSPETLTLPDQPQHTPIQSLPDPNTHSPNPNQDQDVQDPNPTITIDDFDAPTAGGGARRGLKRKKFGPKRTAQEKKAREKLQVLVKTLKPIPFVPAKSLDFESHKSLLQRLGLWEFIHLDFDSALRGDLLRQLIANYAPPLRCSYVNGVRINVNRADLGRALKLPKKTSAAGSAGVDSAQPESIAFVEELVFNWMVLHDDAYILTNDVLGSLKLIKEGNFEKVDWAGLIWSMVEKELKAPSLESCYYASHLQLLIKAQHGELLERGVVEEEVEVRDEGEYEVEVKDEGEEEVEVKDEGEEEVEVKEEAEEVEVKDEAEEEVVVRDGGEDEDEEAEEMAVDEVDGSGDVKMGGVDEGHVREMEEHKMEEHKIELSLGQDNNVERVVEVEKEQGDGEQQLMDFEQTKEDEQPMWLLDNQKTSLGDPFLRPCHGSEVKGADCDQVKVDEGEDEQGQEEEEEEEEEAEEDEQEGGFHLSPKCIPLEGMTSGNGSLIQAMEVAQMPFSTGIDLRDNSVGDFLSSRDEPQMISGSSLFGNGHKRDIGCFDNHNSHHSLNGSNKRMRSDSPWNPKLVDFETCMEQMEHWMGKARMMYAAKDQASEESSMNQQYLINELQRRDNAIEHLQKTKMEEAQKRQAEVYRLEKELYMMQSLVDGYRKALKETHKAFAEYRVRCPQADEPLYKDVPGSGGLVLSVMELEKERLKKEEEERTKLRELMRDFEKKSKDMESTWFGKFEGHMNSVESMGERLLVLADQVKHLNEASAKHKVSDPIESAPTIEGETA